MKCQLFIAVLATMVLSAPLAMTPLATAQDGAKPKPGLDVKSMVKTNQTLQEILNAKKAQSAAKLPPELMTKIANGIDAARDGGVEQSAKNVGDAAPDATLNDFNGQSIQLSALWKKGPIVLMWYRGGW